MNRSFARVGLLALSLSLLGGCCMHHAATTMPAMMPVPQPLPGQKVAFARIGPAKAATTQPTDNDVTGLVTFTEADGKVTIVADVIGLVPLSRHGFHIHDKPDLSAPDLSSAGGHYDPDHTGHHGNPEDHSQAIHAGDMGNLVADEHGRAHLEMTVTDLTVDGPKNPAVGHSVIIHAKSDDLLTQPTGNSGSRIAGGVIEEVK